MVPRERETQMYEFGPFRLDSADRLLMRDGEVVALPPKVLDTLLVLVENSGHVLEKEDLLKRLWPDTFVEEGSLTRNISYLRKALGESDSARQYIETIPRRGYRFIAPVKLAGTGLNEIPARQPNEIDSTRTEAEGDLAGRAFNLPALGSGQDRRPGSVNGFHGSNGLAHREEFAGTFSTPGTILNRPWRSGRWMLVTASVAVPLILIAWWLYQTSGWNRPADGWASSASKPRLDKLTHTGQAKIPALSTDGKWVAYVQDDGHLSSVWLRQTANGSQVQIVPPADASYQGLTFSRDGDYLYYVVYEKGQTFGALYQI